MVRRLLLSLLVLFVTSAGMAHAAEPPTRTTRAPGRRNTCGTTGKGSYRTYGYGLRWFGDYRGAIAGVDGPAFCIDLRYWYPSQQLQVREALGRRTAQPRRRAISASDLRR